MATRWYEFVPFKRSDWFVILVIGMLVVLVLWPFFGTHHRVSPVAISLSNMRQLGIVCYAYAIDHEDQWPDSFDRIAPEYLDEGQRGERSIFINPREGYLTYRLIPLGVTLGEIPPETPVLYEVKLDGTLDPHGCIGYADGHVEGPRDRSEGGESAVE